MLVKRGTSDGSELKLGQKVSNIWSFQSSVAAVIIYNNEPGDLSNGASDVNLWVPALTISQEAGEALLAQENPTVTVDHSKLMEASKDYNSSDFSSWGVTPDLKLKPEIMAPGGNVYSSVLDGQYAYMSGTSMATPQMTGIAAQVRQYVDEDAKFSALSDAEKGDIVTQLLMSTAKPVADGDSYVSPRHQGAGMANVPAPPPPRSTPRWKAPRRPRVRRPTWAIARTVSGVSPSRCTTPARLNTPTRSTPPRFPKRWPTA